MVCDQEGIILEMNDRSAKMFQEQGGESLLGSNLIDCHPEPARTKLMQFMEQRKPNVYTIEKKGLKKMIYQTPWYTGGHPVVLWKSCWIFPRRFLTSSAYYECYCCKRIETQWHHRY